MKQSWIKLPALLMAIALVSPAILIAQEEKDKVKEEKVKEEKVRKEGEQIIITRKGDKDTKCTIEINGDKITINGKPIEEYKDGDVSISRRSGNNNFYFTPGGSNVFNGNKDNLRFLTEDANHAMLGVTTEKNESGAKVNDITKESAAEKIGLKEGDIITKIDDTKIEDPDGLSKAIRAHKIGDKVTVTYLRDKKEQKATAELSKWKSAFKMDMKDMNLNRTVPKIQTLPKTPYGQNFTWSTGGPKLGLSVQDTDAGKGVKVIEVDEESHAAKAGVKENDVIMEVDGKAVNSTDEMVKIIKESKDKNSIMIKLQRSGKTQNIEVTMPKKVKKADI
jgi:serine protease Do